MTRIAAITLIFLCTTIAWAILGTTIFQRTYDSGSASDSRVESTWGAPHKQLPPRALFEETIVKKELTIQNGAKVTIWFRDSAPAHKVFGLALTITLTQ